MSWLSIGTTNMLETNRSSWASMRSCDFLLSLACPLAFLFVLVLLLPWQYGLPLTILSYRDLYGWSMDEIVRQVGRRNNCTFCGVFRRQVRHQDVFCRIVSSCSDALP